MSEMNFVITFGDYSEYVIVGVVNDRTLAIERCAELNKMGYGYHRVEEYPHDVMRYDDAVTGSGKLRETFAREYSTWDEYEQCLTDEVTKRVVREEKEKAEERRRFLAPITEAFNEERKNLEIQNNESFGAINRDLEKAKYEISNEAHARRMEVMESKRASIDDLAAREQAAIEKALNEDD